MEYFSHPSSINLLDNMLINGNNITIEKIAILFCDGEIGWVLNTNHGDK
jgi:hypothetical protein